MRLIASDGISGTGDPEMDWECVPHRIKPLALDGGFGVGGCPSAYKWAIRLKLNYTTLRLSDAWHLTMMMRKPNEGILEFGRGRQP
jgi:hypothetical protein